MKRFVFFCLIAVISAALVPAQSRVPELSGVFDSTVNYTAGDSHSWGIEEYANLRLRVRPSNKLAFNAAFNVIAVSGNYLQSPGWSQIFGNENYAANLELERLFFRINGEHIDTEAGLLRMGFGYGNIWGPSDFINPRSPLSYNARPRGVLGVNFTWYPADSLKLMVFGAAPKNAQDSGGGGIIPGFSLDQHWDRASLQVLYGYQTQLAGSPWGIHRFGLSVKADLGPGFAADALYTFNPDNPDDIEGLSASAGFDYSFLGGDLYFLTEYLFNGFSSSTAFSHDNIAGRRNHHYLSGTILYRFNDYCSAALSTAFCFDDLSFSPSLSLDYDIFQGFSMNLSVRVPLDQKILSGGTPGEFGPAMGARVITNAGVKLRF
ncbi:MAG: hypothetical protein LBH43_09400 [Treponema sp.]|nr:hypothetical protein [Treponema sp.]